MKIYNIKNMSGGWFVGNFSPAAYNSKDFEICYKFHAKGEYWDPHFHKIITEITLVVSGIIKINDLIFKNGDIFVIEPEETVYPEFIEDCELIVIKTPSIPGDKYIIKQT